MGKVKKEVSIDQVIATAPIYNEVPKPYDYIGAKMAGLNETDVMLLKGAPVFPEIDDVETNYQRQLKNGTLKEGMTREQFGKLHALYSAEMNLVESNKQELRDRIGRTRPYLPLHTRKLPGDPEFNISDPTTYKHSNPEFRLMNDGRKVRIATHEEALDMKNVFRASNGNLRPLDLYKDINSAGIKTRFDFETGKDMMLVEQPDMEFGSIWAEMPVESYVTNEAIRSMAGPQSMRQGAIDAFGDSFVNTFVDMGRGSWGSVIENLGNGLNMVNDSWGQGLMEAGNRNQNLANIRKSKMSLAFENAGMFSGDDKALAWGGFLGQTFANAAAVMALGYTGAGLGAVIGNGGRAVNIMRNIAQGGLQHGVMGAYAAGMVDQEMKRMGMSREERLLMYPAMFAMTSLTEIYLGKALGGRFETGLGLFQKKGAQEYAESGLSKFIQENFGGTMPTPAELTRTKKWGGMVKSIFDSAGDGLENYRVGRAIKEGVSEGIEENVQGFMEQSMKMFHDYYYYGELDDDGKQRKSGKGLFGLYGENGPEGGKLFEGIRENFLGGFIGAFPAGLMTPKSYNPKNLLENYTVGDMVMTLAQEGKGMDEVRIIADNIISKHGPQLDMQDVAGNWVTSPVDAMGNKITTKADVWKADFIQQSELAFRLHNQYKDAKIINEKMGGDTKLLKEGITQMLNVNTLTKLKAEKEAEFGKSPTKDQQDILANIDKDIQTSKNYGEAILNGEVYGHFLASNAVNSTIDGKPFTADTSFGDFETWFKNRHQREKVSTVLSRTQQVADRYREGYAIEKQKIKDVKKLVADTQNNDSLAENFRTSSENAKNNGQNSIDNAHNALKNVMVSYQDVFKSDKKFTAKVADDIKGSIALAKSHAMSWLVRQLKEGKNDEEKKKIDDLHNTGVIEHATGYNEIILKYPELAAITNIDENGIKAIEDYDIDKMNDDLSMNAVLYAINNSDILEKKTNLKSFINNGKLISNVDIFIGEVLTELQKPQAVASQKDIKMTDNLIAETEDIIMGLGTMHGVYMYEKMMPGSSKLPYINKAFGITGDPEVEEILYNSDTPLRSAELNLMKLRSLKEALMTDSTGRRALDDKYRSNYEEIENHILHVIALASDFQMDPDLEKLTAQKRLELLDNLRDHLIADNGKNYFKLWEVNSDFRELLKTEDKETDIDSNESIFSVGLENFTLENFKNNSGVKFRRHFVVNHLFTLIGVSPSSIANTYQESLNENVLPGGFSFEQQVVMNHTAAFIHGMKDDKLKKLLMPLIHFSMLTSYTKRNLFDKNISFSDTPDDKILYNMQAPGIYLWEIFKHLPDTIKKQILAIEKASDRQKEIKKYENQVDENTRKKIKYETDTLQKMGVDPKFNRTYGRYVKHMMMLQGNQGSGKTSRLRITLEALSLMMGDNLPEIVFVTHSSELKKMFEGELAALKKNTNGKVTGKVILKDSLFNKNGKNHVINNPEKYKGKIVIMDEITLTRYSQIIALNEIDGLIIGLGDRYQGSEGMLKTKDKDDDKENSLASSLGLSVNLLIPTTTLNLTMMFRAGQTQLFTQIRNNIMHIASRSKQDKDMPIGTNKAFMYSDTNNKRQGVRIFKDMTSMRKHVEERIEEVKKTGDFNKIAIIVGSNASAKKIAADLNIALDTGDNKIIFTFDEEYIANNQNNHVQGLGREEVYSLLDEADFTDKVAYNRAVNTSMGRVKSSTSNVGYYAAYSEHFGGSVQKVDQSEIERFTMDDDTLTEDYELTIERLEEMLGDGTKIPNKAKQKKSKAGTSRKKKSAVVINEDDDADG